METDTIQDFIAYRENTILRMIPGFRILATMIPETFRSTTVIGNACRKTVTIQNTGIISKTMYIGEFEGRSPPRIFLIYKGGSGGEVPREKF